MKMSLPHTDSSSSTETSPSGKRSMAQGATVTPNSRAIASASCGLAVPEIRLKSFVTGHSSQPDPTREGNPPMAEARNIAVLVGSLRKDSFNRKMALAAKGLAPESLALEIVEIG